MALYHRRLPHVYATDHPVFLTCCLYDSLPTHRTFRKDNLSHGQAFAAMDRLLDEARTGTFYLRQPELAQMVMDAIHYNANILKHYELHAFVVMPNHMHLLVTPGVPLPKLTRSLKGITAKRANAYLGLTGRFWQDETYDHTARNSREFENIRNYIEENPVRAGLVREAGEFRWSSGAAGGPPAGQGAHPTKGKVG
jgi:putative transposase